MKILAVIIALIGAYDLVDGILSMNTFVIREGVQFLTLGGVCWVIGDIVSLKNKVNDKKEIIKD